MRAVGTRVKGIALAAVSLLALWLVPTALGGYGVQPGDGSTVTSAYPTFLVYVGAGETLPMVEVSTSPDHSDYGFNSFTGACAPTTPFTEANKFSCQLPFALSPGTYYWAYTYEATVNVCTTFLGTQSCLPELQPRFSGPFEFAVGQPTPPAIVSLVGPYDGATVGTMPTLTVHAPAGATMEIYASSSSERLSDGSPAADTAFSCGGTADIEQNYTCPPSSVYDLTPGETYYWWAIITVDGSGWIYGPRSFTIRQPSNSAATAAASSSAASSAASARTVLDAPRLRTADRWTGKSIKEKRLTAAVYSLTKIIGAPKMVDVACWSTADWATVSGDSGDGVYQTLGFYTPLMPHWVELSPGVCRAMETLLHHRPTLPNKFTANAVETLTHETMHAIGITKDRFGKLAEPMAECFGMQLSVVLAVRLGVPYRYAARLAQLNLVNYKLRPPSYRNTALCREDGTWDLFKNRPSPPWHTPQP